MIVTSIFVLLHLANMHGETQPLITDEQTARVKKPSLHKGWFFVIGLVTTIFIVGAVFHKQLGSIFDLKKYVLVLIICIHY